MAVNTTPAEDRVMGKAADFGGLADDLIEIIERLDAIIETDRERMKLAGLLD